MDNFCPCFLLVLTYSIISDFTKNNDNNPYTQTIKKKIFSFKIHQAQIDISKIYKRETADTGSSFRSFS